jgi:hypothetical protein
MAKRSTKRKGIVIRKKKAFTKGDALIAECIAEVDINVYENISDTIPNIQLVEKGQSLECTYHNHRELRGPLAKTYGDMCFQVKMPDGGYADLYSNFFTIKKVKNGNLKE